MVPDTFYTTVEGGHQQRDMEHVATSNILPKPNQLYDIVEEEQDMEIIENQAYSDTPNVEVEPNPCYGTVDPYTTVEAAQNIPVEPNQCYVTTTPSDQLYVTVEREHQQQDMELTENQAYTVTPNIPVEPNQCYSTTIPSVDPEELLQIPHTVV